MKKPLYECYSEQGKSNLPSHSEVNKMTSMGLVPLLVIDSNVCLEIIKFINYKKSATQIDKEKILNLIEFVQKNDGVEVFCLYSFLELTHKRVNLEIDKDKFIEFKNKIDFAFQCPIKYLRLYKFDYNRDYIIFKTPTIPLNTIESLNDHLLPTYCSLLKIRELSLMGLDKQKAQKNISNFLIWLKSEIGMIMGLELQLAINIFGGNSNYLKMITQRRSLEDVRRKLWGTTWDFFHARFSTNKDELSRITGKMVMPFFITNDTTLGQLIENNRLLLKYANDNGGHGSLILTDTKTMHLSDEFILDLSKQSIELASGMKGENLAFNNEKIVRLIAQFEENVSK